MGTNLYTNFVEFKTNQILALIKKKNNKTKPISNTTF